MDEPDLVLVKAEAFTDIEVVCLESWEAAVNAGHPDKAHEILRTGLLAEHYRSLLSEEPELITDAQSAQLRFLLEQFNRALREVDPSHGYPR